MFVFYIGIRLPPKHMVGVTTVDVGRNDCSWGDLEETEPCGDLNFVFVTLTCTKVGNDFLHSVLH